MVSIDEVARLAMELPDVSEGERFGHRTWALRGKAFAWIRPFSKADIKRFERALNIAAQEATWNDIAP